MPNPAHEEDYALKELNHDWADGEAYALLGSSGCGKSTLLNIISGLLHPSQGRILFNDRDVTMEPTTQRNIGVALGHSVLALDNILKGLGEIAIDEDALARDLEVNWEVLAEAIQTVIRAEVTAGRSSIADPYAMLKELTRGHRVGGDELRAFIERLDIPAEAKARLTALSPATYVGLASQLVDYIEPAGG